MTRGVPRGGGVLDGDGDIVGRRGAVGEEGGREVTGVGVLLGGLATVGLGSGASVGSGLTVRVGEGVPVGSAVDVRLGDEARVTEGVGLGVGGMGSGLWAREASSQKPSA